MKTPTPNGHPEELGGAYALNSLSPEDSALYEQYLDQSQQARIEAEELSDTAMALGLATIPVLPSASLKASLMDLIKTTPQLAPLDASAQALRGQAPGTDASAPATSLTRVPEPPALETPAVETPDLSTGSATPTMGAEGRAQARWFQRPGRLLVAASAAVALFIGGTVIGGALNDNQFVEQQAASLAQINAAPDQERASTTTASGQEATLVWSNTLGLSAVLVDALPALPSDQDYQLWYINGEGPLSAGTFDSTGQGTVWRVLDGTMHAGDAVGVTVEPNGGSDAPTSDPIVAFQS